MATATKTKSKKSPPKPASSEPAETLFGPLLGGEMREIDLTELQPNPHNARKTFDPEQLASLAASIENNGLLVPLLVTGPDNIGRYTIIAGERRFRAASSLKLKRLLCRIVAANSAEVYLASLVENIQRSDLSPIEEAQGFHDALEALNAGRAGTRFLTIKEFAESIGKSPSHVSNRLRLLRLPEFFRECLASGDLTATDARDIVLDIAHLPEVCQEIEDWYRSRRSELPGPVNWYQVVAEAVNEHGLWLSGTTYIDDVEWTYDFRELVRNDSTGNGELRQLLDIRQVPVLDPKLRADEGDWCAFNREAFESYVEEQYQIEVDQRLAAQPAQAEHSSDDGAGPEPQVDLPDSPSVSTSKPATEKPPTAEKSSAPQQQAAKPSPSEKQELRKLQTRLYRWKIQHLQRQMIDAIDSLSDADLQCWLLGLTLLGVVPGRVERLREAVTAGKQKIKIDHSPSLLWKTLGGLNQLQLYPLLEEWFRLWCQTPARSEGSDVHPAAVEALAGRLGISLEKSWHISADFLAVLNREEIVELTREWGLDQRKVGSCSTKQSLTDYLVKHVAQQCKYPQCLANLKPCDLP